jgi:hypothetical protein
MKRIDADQHREVWVHGLMPPYLLVDSLGGEPFVALLAVYERLTIAQRASVARTLVAQGCRRLIILAEDGASWRAEIDNASAERFAGFAVPAGQEVEVRIFGSGASREAVSSFLEETRSGGAPLAQYLAIACSADPRKPDELGQVVGATARGEIARLDLAPQGGASAEPRGEGRDLLARAGRWAARGHLFDAYGRCRPCRRELELVLRRERCVMRTWLGDHEALLSIRPLEPGSVATSWTAQHPRLGMLEGLISVVEGTILSIFSSADGKHRGAESFRRVDDDSYLVEGSLFAGPVLMSAWGYELRRIGAPVAETRDGPPVAPARDRRPRS